MKRPLRPLLSGGDRRSSARSPRAIALVRANPSRVHELVALVEDDDWLVSMRALDLLEKLAHSNPDWVTPHKRVFIGPIADSDKWEVRLQVDRALPLFDWTSAQRRRALAILRRDVDFPQTFVRAWALDSLSTLAGNDPSLRRTVRRYLAEFERSGSKALQARARQIREKKTSGVVLRKT